MNTEIKLLEHQKPDKKKTTEIEARNERPTSETQEKNRRRLVRYNSMEDIKPNCKCLFIMLILVFTLVLMCHMCQPPPVCSIHLDDMTAATGQRCQCAHHTPATGREERET